MTIIEERPLETTSRYIQASQRDAIKTVYQALVELITNSDDRYQILDNPGKGLIEIEYHHDRKNNKKICVRDFADGMNDADMRRKLGKYGEQVSGLSDGENVRGTNSRGAKDIAALGKVTFESIPEGNHLYVCEIDDANFKLHSRQRLTSELRESIGIAKGTGTKVTIDLKKSTTLPLFNNLKSELCMGVAISEILSDNKREIVLLDKLKKQSPIVLQRPPINGKVRLSETFVVPGYSYEAKLKLYRSPEALDAGKTWSRLSGIRVKSNHAVHESTMFDQQLEYDAIALHFYGSLTCPGIDDLCKKYDECLVSGLDLPKENPMQVIDPTRKTGLERGHPFFKALQSEVLNRIRPLIDEERKNSDSGLRQIANEKTKRDLNKVAKACSKFFAEKTEPLEDNDGSPDTTPTGQTYYKDGYQLNPPTSTLVIGDSKQFYFCVIKRQFPELSTGCEVQISCTDNSALQIPKKSPLEIHPNAPEVLRAVFPALALVSSSVCTVSVTIGSINASSKVVILSSEAERYSDIDRLCFLRKTNLIPIDPNMKKKKAIEVFAPLDIVNSETVVDISCSNSKFGMKPKCVLKPEPNLGVAKGVIHVCCPEPDLSGELSAILMEFGDEATTELMSKDPDGFRIKPELVDKDFGPQRYGWKQSVLEIAAQHVSIQRYVGDSKRGFPGQYNPEFKVLLAEIVVEAVCTKILRNNSEAGLTDTNGWDLDHHMSELGKLATELSPLVHEILLPFDANSVSQKSR